MERRSSWLPVVAIVLVVVGLVTLAAPPPAHAFDPQLALALASAAGCLLHASESAVQVALEAIQALGGNGYINEYPTGRILRDAKLYAIGAGTNEIRRMLIGRELFNGQS